MGPLSYEHVPPDCAFNDRPVVLTRLKAILANKTNGRLDNLKGRPQQRGAGEYSLCKKCNNLTGHWYGGQFVEWTYQGLYALDAALRAPSFFHSFRVIPLRVIKQIVCMFFSVNSESFHVAQPELARFVRKRDRNGLPPHVRIFAFLLKADRARYCGVSALIRKDNPGSPLVASEIAFPPLGYVMTFDCPPVRPDLVDISYFAKYTYNDFRDVAIRLPVLDAYTPFPCDYRSKEEVLADRSNAMAIA
jgi:hypothetical protein